MAIGTETLFPTAVESFSNFSPTPVVADVNEDIDTGSPTADSSTWDGNGNIAIRYSFDTPSGDLTNGQTQRFRVILQRNSGTGGNVNTPEFSIGVAEAGGTTIADTGTIGILTANTWYEYTFDWDSSILAAQNGSNVEIDITQTNGGGGSPNRRAGIDIAAVNWDLVYTLPAGQASEANVVWV